MSDSLVFEYGKSFPHFHDSSMRIGFLIIGFLLHLLCCLSVSSATSSDRVHPVLRLYGLVHNVHEQLKGAFLRTFRDRVPVDFEDEYKTKVLNHPDTLELTTLIEKSYLARLPGKSIIREHYNRMASLAIFIHSFTLGELLSNILMAKLEERDLKDRRMIQELREALRVAKLAKRIRDYTYDIYEKAYNPFTWGAKLCETRDIFFEILEPHYERFLDNELESQEPRLMVESIVMDTLEDHDGFFKMSRLKLDIASTFKYKDFWNQFKYVDHPKNNFWKRFWFHVLVDWNQGKLAPRSDWVLIKDQPESCRDPISSPDSRHSECRKRQSLCRVPENH